MNIVKKTIVVGLALLYVGLCPTKAQNPIEGDTTNDASIGDQLTYSERNNPRSGIGVDVINFRSVPSCYISGQNLFVVIDSIDNTVDLIYRGVEGKGFDDSVRCFTTDKTKGRHDIQNILRPKSVGFYDGYVLVLASSEKDSSYLAVLDLNGDLVTLVGFNSKSYAFEVFADEVVVIGRNQQGYDIHILNKQNGIEKIAKEDGMYETYHYSVPKQADRIKESDPHGVGLTIVAVMVVFLALVLISLILKGYGSLIMSRQNKRAAKAQAETTEQTQIAAPVDSASVAGDVYAAIAAAIYLYAEEMHDEENTIITIQKVERAWTPWNAKFYNMNRYFQNRK